jgi:hypothetical protein
MGMDFSIVLGNGKEYPGYPVSNRPPVDILDEKYSQGNPNDRKDKNEIPAAVRTESILQGLPQKMDQVLDDHCRKPHTETHKSREYIQEAMSR